MTTTLSLEALQNDLNAMSDRLLRRREMGQRLLEALIAKTLQIARAVPKLWNEPGALRALKIPMVEAADKVRALERDVALASLALDRAAKLVESAGGVRVAGSDEIARVVVDYARLHRKVDLDNSPELMLPDSVPPEPGY